MTEEETPTLRLGPFDNHGTTRALHRGRHIEVEHGLPGETVRVEIVGTRRPRGRIVDLLQPAPDRVVPPCVYFREWACGGCQWQQISYPGQLARKREGVEEAMGAAGLTLAVTATHAPADPWRYRTTAGIALGKSAGFRRHGSLAIVPIRDCPISHALIGRLMAALNDLLASGRLPDFRGRVRLDVRLAGRPGEEGLQVLVRGTEEGASPAEADLQSLTAALSALQEVMAVSVLRPDGRIEATHGELLAPAIVAGRPVWGAAGSFFQTNLRLLPDLIARLREEASPLQGKRVADIYGGVGIFGLFLAEEAEEVVVVEADALAVEAGRRTAAEWGLDNLTFLARRAEEALPEAVRRDVVIVDPPRSGLNGPLLEALLAERPPLVLYVSCLAQSLARDLTRLLEAGYGVEHLELFDFYPQTYHVELLAVLRR
ncbi:MAG: 23S rRNA (uracil(1939)-C(5))-methyltransferase RlmD [Chloroflexi bacterium]|nr:23S rRNA (uracil(1939)-C(5))-methyltransferase RlmD [Chloroflexota bacterium]